MREGLRGFARRCALLVVLLAALTAPAEARRFRVPLVVGSGSSGGASGHEEVIDRVRDLPDTSAFEKDGAFLDVGFLHRRERSRGRVVGDDRAAGFYVLYHGDSYVKLDAPLRSALTTQLGFDPVAGHDRISSQPIADKPRPRPSREERIAAAKALEAWDGRGATSNIPGDPEAAPRPSSGPGGASWLMLAVLIGIGIAVRRPLKRGREAKPMAEVEPQIADAAGFEARVAARLAELAATPAAAAPLPAPPARTFGRRAA